ncbi:MAG: hypothetical protein JOZ07_14170 [Solirubrobacterales bacterium]|nr:hypothetical protein [Solirubrobacterales bacterium]
MDWLIRVYAPSWLVAAELTGSARRLAALPPVAGAEELHGALLALAPARREARAAWSATPGASRLPARGPWTAGRAVAREAAWESGGAAAWAAARLAIGDIAGDRARAAAREIAGDAAATVARSTRLVTSRAAARVQARAALAPTLRELERSALALLDRMLPTAPLSPGLVDGAGRWRWPAAAAS